LRLAKPPDRTLTMNTNAPPTHDRIQIRATRHQGVVSSVEVTLPEAAWMGHALVGMSPEAAVEYAYAHAPSSPRAHAKAVERACAEALGHAAPDLATSLATERWLAAEMVDAHLHRLLLDWPARLGFEPRYNRYAEFHRRLLHCEDADTAMALGGDVLDLVARELLAGFFSRIRMAHGIGEFLDRLEAGGSLSSVMAALIAQGATIPTREDKLPLLGTVSAAAWAASAGHWPDASFVRQPTQDGTPAETGALARHAASQMVKVLLDRGHRVSARLFARAIDLSDLRQPHAPPRKRRGCAADRRDLTRARNRAGARDRRARGAAVLGQNGKRGDRRLRERAARGVELSPRRSVLPRGPQHP